MSDISTGEQVPTTRLALLRPVPADAEAILRICGVTEPWVTIVPNLAAAQRLYTEWDEHWRQHGYGYWAVRAHADDTVLGFCGIRSMTMPAGPALNLFYRLDPATRGRGFAAEAAAAVVAHARTHLPELPVIARIQPTNAASHRVAERAGLSRAEYLDTDSWHHYVTPAGWGRM
ncbi:GNAT family N-acetyltransferase [Nocardia sp. CA2R105]|uniref:GNAT family N-acetyltransferase n=1 Tax=Nocardia coffeae TaxID=2873381 RepID=UPI001CA5F4DA|nr:GNAT family N-acetyltransferase [Nocardia coffeae]MBY8859058.1 GNAT family N-acetyltransferase [Nocardia coffeae]